MDKKQRGQKGRHSSNTYRTVVKRGNRKIKKRKLNKKKVAILIILIIMIVILITKTKKKNKITETSVEQNSEITSETSTNEENQEQNPIEGKEINDWRLTLANYENLLPENFEVKVESIDGTRQFDARAIGELKDMMNAMRNDGISNIWVQSAYRSVARQKELYDNSVQKYLQQGKTKEEAEELTNDYINKPGSSDHNLGLAVDFNYVDNKFEKLDGFKWLKENAENYGFILRYPKDKEDITKISYESWHWRYVGVEHAKKMNELNMCLEEYVEYLKKQ